MTVNLSIPLMNAKRKNFQNLDIRIKKIKNEHTPFS